jgi:mercuric ion transport protein
MQMISRLADKAGSVGALVSAMGCAACFPVLGSLGAALGLGFLHQFEGVFINTLLPVFAGIVLISNLYAAWFHRRWIRMLWGISGPLMILATFYLFWTDNWSTYMFYAGLIIMIAVSIWDLISPPHKVCAVPEQSIPSS